MKKFPYVFDLNWDCKSHADALLHLRHLAASIKADKKSYKELHQELRKQGFSTASLPPEIR